MKSAGAHELAGMVMQVLKSLDSPYPEMRAFNWEGEAVNCYLFPVCRRNTGLQSTVHGAHDFSAENI